MAPAVIAWRTCKHNHTFLADYCQVFAAMLESQHLQPVTLAQ